MQWGVAIDIERAIKKNASGTPRGGVNQRDVLYGCARAAFWAVITVPLLTGEHVGRLQRQKRGGGKGYHKINL